MCERSEKLYVAHAPEDAVVEVSAVAYLHHVAGFKDDVGGKLA